MLRGCFVGFGDPSGVVVGLRWGWQVPRLLSDLIWRNPVGSGGAESGDGLGDLNLIEQPSNTQTLVSLGKIVNNLKTTGS